MLKHTFTIVFGADENTVDIEMLARHLGEAAIAAGGYGVDIDHKRQWVADDAQSGIATAYIDSDKARRSRSLMDPDYSRDHVQ